MREGGGAAVSSDHFSVLVTDSVLPSCSETGVTLFFWLRLNAGIYLLFYTLVGSIPLLIALIFIQTSAGTLNFLQRPSLSGVRQARFRSFVFVPCFLQKRWYRDKMSRLSKSDLNLENSLTVRLGWPWERRQVWLQLKEKKGEQTGSILDHPTI